MSNPLKEQRRQSLKVLSLLFLIWFEVCLPCFLHRFFITNRFDCNIHRDKPNIEKHGMCFVAIVQVLHILVEELELSRALDIARVQFMNAAYLLLKLSLSLASKGMACSISWVLAAFGHWVASKFLEWADNQV